MLSALEDLDFLDETQADSVDNSLISRMKTVWLNEKCCPDLLAFQQTLVNSLELQIEAKVKLGIQNINSN